MYRDDLEAAQARVDALQHEAAVEKERADEAEAEAAELRARNAELETLVPRTRPAAETGPSNAEPATEKSPSEALLRRSVWGWSLILGGVALMLIGGRAGLGEIAQAVGLCVLIVGCWLA